MFLDRSVGDNPRMKHPQKEIRHQLAEIAAYRREIEAEREA